MKKTAVEKLKMRSNERSNGNQPAKEIEMKEANLSCLKYLKSMSVNSMKMAEPARRHQSIIESWRNMKTAIIKWRQ